MRFWVITLILLGIVAVDAQAESPESHFKAYKKYNAYLENSRHVQIPQWNHKEWYAEDWLAQKDGQKMVDGFYKADILREQSTGRNDLPQLIVGPNFYRLSGYDKRRIVHIVDQVQGITGIAQNSAFTLQDWYTRRPIGVFDQHGLRLH